MQSIKNFSLVFVLTLFAISTSSADSKENYNVFNPTPREKMREWATDRPDKTESAYTIDAGHYSHETDIVNYTFDQEGGDRVDAFTIMAPNLKVGLTNRIDLQLVVESFNYVRSKGGGERIKQSGFGDLTTRLKVNMWGNDGGDTAGAIMPYLKFPTNRDDLGNNYLEGGVIVPIAVNEFETVGIGLMTEVDIRHRDGEDSYVADFVNSATAGVDLTDTVAGYTEIWTNFGDDHGPLVTFDFGLTYAVVEDTQLDIGMNVGLTDQSDDLNPFLGISQRF